MNLPSYLSDSWIESVISAALAEDVGDGDITSLATIPPTTNASAHFLVKQDGIVSGLYVAEKVFDAVDKRLFVQWDLRDGDTVSKGTVLGKVRGPARALLTAERVALNLMQRMSGVATATHAMTQAAKPHKARILDTRKTVPGLRLLDKWAVLHGGGMNHRIGLYDRVLIKDNHISAAGGIENALSNTRQYLGQDPRASTIEIETRTLQEVAEVIRIGGVRYILLDNMVKMLPDGTVDVAMLQTAVNLIGQRFLTEASGNVTLETIPTIAATGVDYISSGALTHSVTALDISLKIHLR